MRARLSRVAGETPRRTRLLALLGVCLLSASLYAAPVSGAATRQANASNFTSVLSAAQTGDTIALASGSYTFTGTGKAVTITPAAGALPIMDSVTLDTGDTGFTLDGITLRQVNVWSGAHDFTIRNSTFTGSIIISGSGISGVLLDHNAHDWMVGPSPGWPNAKIFVSVSGTLAAPGVTIQDSSIRNGDLDGVHLGGSGVQILRNQFIGLCDQGANHTDAIQLEGGSAIRIAGNYVREVGCSPAGLQGITSYDGDTNGIVIEDNVVDVRRPWGIELYADTNSVVRHNTLRYYPDADCAYGGLTCGAVDINRKPEDPPGSGTHVYDNLATGVRFINGSTGTADHNVSGQDAPFVGLLGGGTLTSWASFALSHVPPPVPADKYKASDGLDVGICAGTVTPTPTDVPAQAVWTAPTSAKVGVPVRLDGSGSTGNAPLTCTWTFENQSASVVYETIGGCVLSKTFTSAGTKYVRLTVRDADGDTNARRRSFTVRA